MIQLFSIAVLAAALGSGLMSGLFFTFSNFGLKAFAALPPNQGISAMQSINTAILNRGFLTTFLGTAVCSLVVVILATLNWEHPGVGWGVCGAVFYLIGCIAVTGCFNVPLNDKLAAIDPENVSSFAVWREYLSKWTPWNHVRTVATLAATITFIVALRKGGMPS